VGLRHLFRFVRQDLPNVTLLKPRNRRVHAHLITMHQSGSHWLNYMLSLGLCRVYGVSELQHIADRSLVGRPQDTIVYPGIPRLVQSHEIPSPLVHAFPLPQLLRFPRYVLLLRDVRAAMVSQYEKKRHMSPFQISFSEYLRNERVIGNAIRRDLWHRMRLLNAWDRDIRRLPKGQVLITRYELMKEHAARELQRVWDFLEFPLQSPVFFQSVVAASTKDQMAAHEQPGAHMKVVRASQRHPFEWFSPEDRDYFTATVRRHLRNWFGYDYTDWTLPAASERRAA
jgi:hypothetical protein